MAGISRLTIVVAFGVVLALTVGWQRKYSQEEAPAPGRGAAGVTPLDVAAQARGLDYPLDPEQIGALAE